MKPPSDKPATGVQFGFRGCAAVLIGTATGAFAGILVVSLLCGIPLANGLDVLSLLALLVGGGFGATFGAIGGVVAGSERRE